MKKLFAIFFIIFTNLLSAQISKQFINKLNNGIDPFFSFASIIASNIHGGLEQNTRYAGQIYTGINIDLEEILGWRGTKAKISLINRHGKGLSDQVGSVFEPLNLVGGQNTFLYDLSIEKNFNNQLFLKLGRTTSSDDFSVSNLYYFSLNNTVNGLIRALLLDGLMTTFPFSTWGARLKYKPNTKNQFQIGAYQLGKNIFDDTNHGMDFSFRNSDRLSLFFQYDWFGKIANLKSRIYIGTNQAFGTFLNFQATNELKYFQRYYGHIDIELLNGLNTFLTMTYSQQGEIAKVPFQSSLGFNWKGFNNSRLEDRILLFATIGNFSEEWAKFNSNNLSTEIVLETGYRFQLNNNFALQPAIQYNINPGGSQTIKNAIIPGILMELNF